MKVEVEAVAKKNKSDNTISENRKARFDYEISKNLKLEYLYWVGKQRV